MKYLCAIYSPAYTVVLVVVKWDTKHLTTSIGVVTFRDKLAKVFNPHANNTSTLVYLVYWVQRQQSFWDDLDLIHVCVIVIKHVYDNSIFGKEIEKENDKKNTDTRGEFQKSRKEQ